MPTYLKGLNPQLKLSLMREFCASCGGAAQTRSVPVRPWRAEGIGHILNFELLRGAPVAKVSKGRALFLIVLVFLLVRLLLAAAVVWTQV